MTVKQVGKKYYFTMCDNEVEVIKSGGGELICYGKPMQSVIK